MSLNMIAKTGALLGYFLSTPKFKLQSHKFAETGVKRVAKDWQRFTNAIARRSLGQSLACTSNSCQSLTVSPNDPRTPPSDCSTPALQLPCHCAVSAHPLRIYRALQELKQSEALLQEDLIGSQVPKPERQRKERRNYGQSELVIIAFKVLQSAQLAARYSDSDLSQAAVTARAHFA
jgi:hypothetical protein